MGTVSNNKEEPLATFSRRSMIHVITDSK